MTPIRPDERFALVLLAAALTWVVWAATAGDAPPQPGPVRPSASLPTRSAVATPRPSLATAVASSPTRTASPTTTATATPGLTATATATVRPPAPSPFAAPAPEAAPTAASTPTVAPQLPTPPTVTPAPTSGRPTATGATEAEETTVVLEESQYYTLWWTHRTGQRVRHTVWVEDGVAAIFVTLVGPDGTQIVTPRAVVAPVTLDHTVTATGDHTLWLDRSFLKGPPTIVVHVRTVVSD